MKMYYRGWSVHRGSNPRHPEMVVAMRYGVTMRANSEELLFSMIDTKLSEEQNEREAREKAKTTRVGTVVVFKPGTTKAEAEQALKALEPLVDTNYGTPLVHEYDEEYGGPVWYIP